MANAKMSAEEEHHPENPLNHEEGNLRDGKICVDLNNNQDNKSKLQRSVKELRSKLKKVKENNKRILKTREELNVILLSKIHNDEKEKNTKHKQDMPETAPYKRKGRKLEFSSHNTRNSSEESVKHHSGKQQDSRKSSDDNKMKNKYKSYE